MKNGHELIKIDEKTNKVANLHTKESNQVAYRPLYIIQEDGTIKSKRHDSEKRR